MAIDFSVKTFALGTKVLFSCKTAFIHAAINRVRFVFWRMSLSKHVFTILLNFDNAEEKLYIL